MGIKFGTQLITVLCLFLTTGLAAQAASIRSLPGIAQIAILETSGGNTPFFAIPDASILTTRLPDRLSSSNHDYQSNANEYYDFFYSNADGTFNADGAFLTMTAVFDNASDSGLNIASAWLVFPGMQEYASVVSSFVVNGDTAIPSSVSNAIGNTPGTTTFLGHTLDPLGLPAPIRLSLTLGFESTGVSAVPLPAAFPLFGTGILAMLGFVNWRRKRADASA